MTQTDKLTGRALDVAVAERVMGLKIAHRDWPCGEIFDGAYVAAPSLKAAQEEPWYYPESGPVYKVSAYEGSPSISTYELIPFYSRDIAEAWPVHLKMIADWETLWDYARELNALVGSLGARKIDVAMALLKELTPELICRAALAVTKRNPQKGEAT